MEFLYILSYVMERSSSIVTFEACYECAVYLSSLHTIHPVLNLARLRGYMSNIQISHKIVYLLDKKL